MWALMLNNKNSRPDRDESHDDLAVPPWFPHAAGTSLQRSAETRPANRQPWERWACPSLLLAETRSGLHVQIAAPEGFSACCAALARTGSRFADSLTQAYSFPSSLLGVQLDKIMPQITDAVNSIEMLGNACGPNPF